MLRADIAGVASSCNRNGDLNHIFTSRSEIVRSQYSRNPDAYLRLDKLFKAVKAYAFCVQKLCRNAVILSYKTHQKMFASDICVTEVFGNLNRGV